MKSGALMVVIIIMAILGAGMFIRNTEKSREPQSFPIEVEPTEVETAEVTPTEGVEAEEGNGIVEGSLYYPSDFIPEDMTVCAEPVEAGGEEICTNSQIKDEKYVNGIGYQLNLAPGKYQVYAKTGMMTDYKAYYSDFVTCGLSVECQSHEPIEVTVLAGETLDGVDPADWYKQ